MSLNNDSTVSSTMQGSLQQSLRDSARVVQQSTAKTVRRLTLHDFSIVLGLVFTAPFPIYVIRLFYLSLVHQEPMCWNSYDAREAAVLMQQEKIHESPSDQATDAMDLSPLDRGFNTACEPYVNKTDLLEHVGPWIPDDSYFRNESLWAPFHFSTVAVVGWDVLEDGHGAEVQTVARLVSLNIFNAPLWFREQILFLSMDYHICAYFNESTRLIAGPSTNTSKLQIMVYTNTSANAPDDKNLAYGYEIVNAGPYTELLGNNTFWGRTRLHLADQTHHNYGFGRKCYVWSHFYVGGTSISYPAFPIIAAFSICFFLLFVYHLVRKWSTSVDEDDDVDGPEAALEAGTETERRLLLSK